MPRTSTVAKAASRLAVSVIVGVVGKSSTAWGNGTGGAWGANNGGAYAGASAPPPTNAFVEASPFIIAYMICTAAQLIV